MTWMLFWKILFIAVMVVFTVMSVLVTVLGAGDIRRLLAGLRDDAIEADSESADADPEKASPIIDASDGE